MDDSQIVELYCHRDENAICETNRKYGAYCFTIAENILSNGEDAEECVNDTWLKTWNSIPPQKPALLKLFLAKITRNVSFDKYRKKVTSKRGGGEIVFAIEELEDCLSSSADVESEICQKELKSTINRFLHSLPERDCNIFLRRYFYVESTSEIAARYGLKENNVLLILSRTRKKLKSHLQKEGYII